MAQQHFNPQVGQNIPGQQANLQQMFGQTTTPTGSIGNIPMQNINPAVMQPTTSEKTVVDELEAAYQSCLAPLLPGSDNQGNGSVNPDKLRAIVDHSIQQFMDTARRMESYFLKKHATVAQQQPELILQEEIDELKAEIIRRDNAIRNHANKVQMWQQTLRNIQSSVNARGGPVTAPAPNPIPQPSGVMHPDMMQRR